MVSTIMYAENITLCMGAGGKWVCVGACVSVSV